MASAVAWSFFNTERQAMALAPCAATLLARLRPVAAALDARLLAVAQIAPPNGPQALIWRGGVFPGGWRERYEAEGLGADDPVARTVRRSLATIPLELVAAEGEGELAALALYRAPSTRFGWAQPFRNVADGELHMVVLAGGTPIDCPETDAQRRLLARSFGDELLARAQPPTRPTLTSRQRACLLAAGRGLISLQIGAELGLSAKTVDIYLAAAAHRLGAPNRVSAVTTALRLGLI